MEIQNTEITNMATQTSMNKIDCSEVDVEKQAPTEAAIQAWLISYLTKLLELNLDVVDTKVPFSDYGLDSLTAVAMSDDLEQWLGYEVDPSLPYNYSTIESLAQYLAEKCKVEA